MIRAGVLIGVLLIALGCNDADRPTAPTPLAPPPSTVQPPPANVDVPPGGSRYDFSAQLSYAVRDYTAGSRYVLSPAGTFSLQYSSLGAQYVGTYRQDGDRISFRFSADGRWDAIGVLSGDSLRVEYNVIMELSDFENALYRRVP